MDTVLGIRLEDGVITICPKTDARLGFAEGSYDSPVGMIKSSWKYTAGKVSYEVEIPDGVKAFFVDEDGNQTELHVGTNTLYKNV